MSASLHKLLYIIGSNKVEISQILITKLHENVKLCKSIHYIFLLRDESCSPPVCSELINLFVARIKH